MSSNPAAVREEVIEHNGLSSNTLLSGDRSHPAVLLLHGAGPGANAAANWLGAMPDLAQHFYVIAPDLIGFGKSAIPEPAPNHISGWIGVRVEQVLGLMDALDLTNVHVVGNSMGGALTLQLLSEAGERFDKVILMGSIGGPMVRTPELTRLLEFYSDPRESRYREIMRSFAFDPDRFQGMNDIIASRFKIATDPAVRKSAERMIESMRQGMEGLIMPPSILNKIPHEVLILHGRQDRIVPLDASLYLLEHLGRASLFVIDRSGHWLQLERWDLMKPLLERHFGVTSWT